MESTQNETSLAALLDDAEKLNQAIIGGGMSPAEADAAFVDFMRGVRAALPLQPPAAPPPVPLQEESAPAKPLANPLMVVGMVLFFLSCSLEN